MNHKLKTAYIVGRFPSLTATFIMNEMYWIRHHDIEIYIFSLNYTKSEPVHERAKMLLPHAHYNPFFSWVVLMAQLYFLWRSPGRYIQALAKTFQYTYREPKVLLQALIIFPKSVLFARQAEALGIEHVHAHFILMGSISASIISKLLDIPLTIHPHAVGLFARNQQAIRLQLEDASRVTTISSYHQDYIANLCPHIDRNDVEVIHCGIETDRFRQTANRAENTPIRILSVGRLVEKKGHEYLVDACAILARRGLTFQCKIVGVGPNHKTLQARIDQLGLHNWVILLGAIDQTQIIELCQTSDIFALACVTAKDGNRDGVPVSLMETMACELPVVTTPIAGIPDLVQDRETGLLVEERNADSLANALQELIENRPLCDQLGKQARRRVVESFEIHRNVAKLARIFRHVAITQRHDLPIRSLESP